MLYNKQYILLSSKAKIKGGAEAIAQRVGSLHCMQSTRVQSLAPHMVPQTCQELSPEYSQVWSKNKTKKPKTETKKYIEEYIFQLAQKSPNIYL